MKWISLIQTLLLCIWSATATAGGNNMPDHKQQAEDYYSQGRFPQANKEFLQALDMHPEDSQILLKLGLLALWENRPEQSLKYLHSAYEHSAWLGRTWPMSAQLAYRIGSAYQRKDDFTNAVLWYKRAAGPWPLGPLKTVKALQKQLKAFGTSQPYRISGPVETRLRFVMLDPLPVVEISLNGRGPYTFFIDTGGAELILVDDLAKELGLQVYGEFSGSFAGGKKGLVKLGKLESVTLGETTVKNLPVHIMGLEGIGDIFGRKIDGAIGTSLLRHFYPTIDYANRQLILRPVTDESRTEIDRLAANATSIPFWLVEQHMMMARGHINDVPDTLFFVDTGLAKRGFLISRASQEAAGIAVDWTQAKQGVGGGGKVRSVDFTLDKLTLGEGAHSIVKKQLGASMSEGDLDIFTGALGFKVGGLVSHGFFKGMGLTLDFQKMRLILE